MEPAAPNLSEAESRRQLQRSPAADAVDTALAAAEGAGNRPERRRSEGVIWIRKLWGVAQLEGINAEFESRLAIYGESLEQGNIVLNITGSEELVTAGVS